MCVFVCVYVSVCMFICVYVCVYVYVGVCVLLIFIYILNSLLSLRTWISTSRSAINVINVKFRMWFDSVPSSRYHDMIDLRRLFNAHTVINKVCRLEIRGGPNKPKCPDFTYSTLYEGSI